MKMLSRKDVSLKMFRALVGLLFLLSLPAEGITQATDEGLEITGLLLDETKTKGGHDFFYVFNSHWQQVEGLDYSIIVTELPSRGRGSVILVNVNNTVVYRNFLNPRAEAIEEEAKRATRYSIQFLLQNLNVQQELEMY